MGRNSQVPRRFRTRWSLLALTGLALLAPAGATAQGDGSAEPRIVGGTTASISQYPWQAAVVFSGAGNAHNRQFCGGALVTSRIVLTAAHCVFDTDPDCSNPGQCAINDPGGDGTVKLDANDVDVVLGRTTLSDTGSGVELGTVAAGYQGDNGGAPAYNPATAQNDVGYLVLSAASGQVTIHIAGGDETAVWAPGTLVDISGWGSTSESGGTVDTLRKASVPIVDDTTCVADYAAFGAFVDPQTMVCAGYEGGGVDTCYGDSGGPLEAPLQDGSYRLVGLTSWGEGCAEPNAPGVYTRVAQPALRDAIAARVSSLETANGISHENIVGSGGQPRVGSPAAPSTGTAATPARADPFAKCRKLKNKLKRKRCFKKVKRALANA
jgi:secreted trypsin-like serine protease